MGARHGDLIPLLVQKQIRETVLADLKRRSPAERNVILEEMPTGPLPGINRNYPVGAALPTVSPLLLACLLGTLALWHWSTGSVSIDKIGTPKAEIFYWVTITFSQTLGTALGDWIADTTGLGYEGGAIVFAAVLLVLVALYYRTQVSRIFLFWAAFILTRPLGATLGDLLDKPHDKGGLDFSRPLASLVLGVFILGCILLLPQRAGQHPGEVATA